MPIGKILLNLDKESTKIIYQTGDKWKYNFDGDFVWFCEYDIFNNQLLGSIENQNQLIIE